MEDRPFDGPWDFSREPVFLDGFYWVPTCIIEYSWGTGEGVSRFDPMRWFRYHDHQGD
jgi:hypothetical protein